MDCNLIRQEVLSQEAYPVENTCCAVRLDANENPLPMPEKVRERFAAVVQETAFNRYPQAGSMAVAARFAESLGVSPDQVVLGNGSDELIQLLCTACSCPGRTVLIPGPTFAMYGITARNNGLQVVQVPLGEDFDLDLPAMLESVRAFRPTLTFLAYPNNPTGNCFSAEKIGAILEASPGIVVVDEAYYHFSLRTFLPLLGRHPNLVILRSLSKIGLAALRIGLLIGQADLVRQLNKVRLPYNLNSLSQAAAILYLEEEEAFLAQAALIRRWREELLGAMAALPGVHPFPTDANFIFFSCDLDADRIYSHLRDRGVLIKNMSRLGAGRFLRVTVGTPAENAAFLQALGEAIK